MRKKSVRDLSDAQVRGKRALVRVDFNVPLDDDGQVTERFQRSSCCWSAGRAR